MNPGTLKRLIKRKMSPRKRSRSKSIKELDRLFSLHVRAKNCDSRGMVRCYTCDKWFPIKNIQNGHYISRFYKYTRWEEDNCRPQCMMCNMWKRGDIPTFRSRLVTEIGEDRVKELEILSKKLFKEKDEWIEERLNLYTGKISPSK